MNKKKVLVISLLALIFVLLILFIFSQTVKKDKLNTNSPLIDNNQSGRVNLFDGMEPLEFNNTSYIADSDLNKPIFEKYTKDNISKLSPEEAVLGGTFFVTDIEWISYGSAFVDYEDGHIALTALVSYKLKDDGDVDVTSFDIVTESNAPLTGDDFGNASDYEIPGSRVELLESDFESLDW